MSAACTFSRIFGNDLKRQFPPEFIDRLSERFGKKIPENMFTPCEIQEFCMERRGQPSQAVKDLPRFIQDRISGKHDFEYDINRQGPPQGAPAELDDEDSETDDKAYASLEASLPDLEIPANTGRSFTDVDSPSGSSTLSSLYDGFVCSTDDTKLPYEVHDAVPGPPTRKLYGWFRGLFSASKHRQVDTVHPTLLPDLSKYDYSIDVGRVPQSPLRSQVQHIQARPVHCAPGVPEIPAVFDRMTQLRQRSNSLPVSRTFEHVSINEENTIDDFQHQNQSQEQDILLEDSESDAYYTPRSTKSKIAETFKHYRRPSHPNLVGRDNAYPYHGPIAEDDGEASDMEHTVCLRSVSPKALEDDE